MDTNGNINQNNDFKVGDEVKVKEDDWSKYSELDIERELIGMSYEVEEVGLGLGLVKLKGFIPLVRTSMIKHYEGEELNHTVSNRKLDYKESVEEAAKRILIEMFPKADQQTIEYHIPVFKLGSEWQKNQKK